MIGRVAGVIIGLALAVFGYGLLNPAPFAHVIDLAHVKLSDFDQYRSLVAYMIIIVGGAVAIAALQRPAQRRRKRAAPTVLSGFDDSPAEPSTPAAHS